jgi:mRNA interferase MazF
MNRGDIVIVSSQGDYGKPRPALVIQSDIFLNAVGSVTMCLITSELSDSAPVRISMKPSPSNGLRTISQVMVDKITTVPADKVRGPIGRADEATLNAVNTALLIFLDLIGAVIPSAETK